MNELFRKDGVTAHPLAGYAIATMPNGHLMLALEYYDLSAPDQPKYLRVAIVRSKATELGEAIKRAAAVPHVEPPEKLS